MHVLRAPVPRVFALIILMRDTCTGTALMCASQYGHSEVTHQLVLTGADMNACDNDGQTAHHIARNAGHEGLAAALQVAEKAAAEAEAEEEADVDDEQEDQKDKRAPDP